MIYWLSPSVQQTILDHRLGSVLAENSSGNQAVRIIEIATESKVTLNPSLVSRAADRAINSNNYADWRSLSPILAPHLQRAIDANLDVALHDTSLQASQSLADVETKTAGLRNLKAQLPPEDVTKTAALLERVVDLHPEAASAWQAAAQMISYRSDLRGQPPALPSCFATQGAGGWRVANMVMSYHDCELDLNDIKLFDAIVPKIWQPGNVEYENAARIVPTIQLTNGIVTYSGGQMIRMQRLFFQNCFFDLRFPQKIPPPPGRALTQQLLVADLSNVSLNLPVAEAGM
jgi:hypothetical protein